VSHNEHDVESVFLLASGFWLLIMFEIIPAIDLRGGKCVRLEEGDATRATEYGDDPVAMALHWQAEGAARLHLVDLDGAFAGGPAQLDAAAAIFRALSIPVQFGGGVRSLEQVARLLDLGAARVIVGTLAVERPDLVEQAVRRHGAAAIVAGIDARNGMVAVRGWVESTTTTAVELGLRMRELGIERVVYTDVARDGMLRGVNVEETENLARRTGLRVIASGGVARLEDLEELRARSASGIEGAILGRALYERKLDLRQALRC
jgi:phosphoribosylformimino-5-aminoimidazole carboxamide ribotide isomerase